MFRSIYAKLFYAASLASIFTRFYMSNGVVKYSGVSLFQAIKYLSWVNVIEIIIAIIHFSVIVIVFKIFKSQRSS